MGLSARRQSRELALQALFQLEFLAGQDLKLALGYFRTIMDAEPAVWTYAGELLDGVQKNRTEIDKLIQEHTSHWKLDRLALVDLNILRLATYELKFSGEQVPPAAVINEAIEIAKKYGTTDSGKFVNGVLDQVHRAAR